MSLLSESIVQTLGWAFAAGLAKAVRDTIDFHWGRSYLSRVHSDWLRLWLSSDWTRRPRHPLWFLWDGWHCFDAQSYLYAGLAFLAGQHTPWPVWIVAFAIASGTFNLFFHKLFIAE